MNEDNEIRNLEPKKYAELIIELIEVVDSVFVEPNK